MYFILFKSPLNHSDWSEAENDPQNLAATFTVYSWQLPVHDKRKHPLPLQVSSLGVPWPTRDNNPSTEFSTQVRSLWAIFLVLFQLCFLLDQLTVFLAPHLNQKKYYYWKLPVPETFTYILIYGDGRFASTTSRGITRRKHTQLNTIICHMCNNNINKLKWFKMHDYNPT